MQLGIVNPSRESRRVVVVSAGLSQPSSSRRLADRLGAATVAAAQTSGEDVVVETVELRDYAVDLADQLVTGFANARLAALIEQVRTADGLVVVSPIFNASYSGLFKMFVDAIPMENLAGMPVLLGATGGSVRHSLALEHAMRPLFAYLRAIAVPTAVFAAPEDWASPTELDHRVDRAGGELAGLVTGAPAVRERSRRPLARAV